MHNTNPFVQRLESMAPRGDESARDFQIPVIEYDASSDERNIFFKQFLEAMATFDGMSGSDAVAFLDQLEKLYCDESGARSDFRHSYSEIASSMVGEYVENQSEPDYSATPRMQHMSNNIDYILAACGKCGNRYSDNLISSLRKLNDHVALEFNHFNYIIQQNNLQNKKRSEAVREYEKRLRQMGDELAQKEEKIKRLEREFIAILGIFSAVVLFANGSVTFFAASISAMADQNVIGVAFIVTAVGTCIFNMLFVLFAFIHRLTNKAESIWGFVSKDSFLKANRLLLVVDGTLLVLSIIVTYCCTLPG